MLEAHLYEVNPVVVPQDDVIGNKSAVCICCVVVKQLKIRHVQTAIESA